MKYNYIFTFELIDEAGKIGLQMETSRIKPDEQEKPVFASPIPIVIYA